MTSQVKVYSRLDLPELLISLGLTGDGVEVGVHQGGYSGLILSRWPGRLFLVDTWYKEYGYLTGDARMDHARQRLAPYVDRTIFLRESSVRAASTFLDGSLDWIYIDADHGYHSALSDLFAWYPKLKVGGVFSGHDYIDFTGNTWTVSAEDYASRPKAKDISELNFCGVKSAVTDFRNYFGLTMEMGVTAPGDGTYWWIK